MRKGLINIYEFFYYFIIYAFFGWCLEVTYQAVEHGKFINRGFLNGPYCPIYGFGVIIVTKTLEPIDGNLLILYIGSVLLTSFLELITGFALERIFKMKWWDYTQEKFNIKGYICLKFSLLWGIACLIAVRLIHPLVIEFVSKIPHTFGVILIIIIAPEIIGDMIFTVLAIIHFKKRVAILEEISTDMKKISDKTGERIFETVEGIRTQKEKFDEKRLLLYKKYHSNLSKHSFNIKRIEKAFPQLKLDAERSLKIQLAELKEKLSERIERKK